jgi:hypothetical protein
MFLWFCLLMQALFLILLNPTDVGYLLLFLPAVFFFLATQTATVGFLIKKDAEEREKENAGSSDDERDKSA